MNRPKLLLAEDSAHDVYFFERAVKRSGVECSLRHVSDGAAAIQVLRESAADQAGLPDLIFLDLAMSGMDGFETLRQLRAEPVTAAIPVIVATSKILTSDERRLLTDLGAPILSKEAFSSKGVVQEVDGLLRSMDLAGLATGSEGHR